MRGQKANIHVLKEMLELCQIIDSEGYNVKDEPSMRVIPFGELFNVSATKVTLRNVSNNCSSTDLQLHIRQSCGNSAQSPKTQTGRIRG